MKPLPRWAIPAGLITVGVLVWLGVQKWTAPPERIDFADEIARVTGNVPEPTTSPKPASGPIRVAIGPLGLGDAARESALANLLLASVRPEAQLEWVERRELARIRQEIDLGAAGLVKPEQAMRMGRLVKADWLVLGAASRSGSASNAVVRLVDGANGMLRDVVVLPAGQEPEASARLLAGWLERARGVRNQAEAGPDYVTVGGFEDVSVRPRHPEVEATLRGSLTAALAGGQRIVLERELTHPLLEEVRMQRAGWLAGSNAPPAFHSTFWVVDGYWQAVGTTGDEIELSLRVSRIGGRVQRRALRGRIGDEIGNRVVAAVADLMRNAPEPEQAPGRKGEIRAQLARGMERSGLTEDELEPHRGKIALINTRWGEPPALRARRGENYRAAIQAFESVLLLDPEHVEAKLFLARCLLDWSIGRPEEACDLYRELLNHRSAGTARRARTWLGQAWMFNGQAPRAMHWFQEQLDQSDESGKTYWQYWLDNVRAQQRDSGEEGTTEAAPAALASAEARLLTEVQGWRTAALAGKTFRDSAAFSTFIDAAGSNRREGRELLDSFVPKLMELVPDLAPHVLVRAMPNGAVTNSPLLPLLDRVLRSAAANPKAMLRPEAFYEDLRNHLRWVQVPQLTNTVVMISDAIDAARAAGVPVEMSPTQVVKAGYALVAVGRWEDALAKFQSLTNTPIVEMDHGGPWGGYPSQVAPFNRVRACHRALGRPEPEDPLGIPIPKPVVVRERPFVFLPDGDRLWLGCCDQLVEFSVRDGRAVTNHLGNDLSQPPQVMAQSADTLWIGTAGAGLLRVDKATRGIQRFTQANGLVSDNISALHLGAGRLWVGCESGRVGGLSWVDPATGKVGTMTPALVKAEKVDGREPWNVEADWTAAPRRPVKALGSLGSGEVWVGVYGLGLLRHDLGRESWTAVVRREEDPSVACLAVSENWVAMGEAPRPRQHRDTHLLTVVPRAGGAPTHLGVEDGLPYPSVTTMAMDGDRLWLGGPSYLAILDLKARRLVKRSLFSDSEVLQMSIEGDNLWVRMNRSVYRYPLSVGRE